MDWKKHPYALPLMAFGGLFLCLFVIFPILGISIFGSQNLSVQVFLYKAATVLLASGCGFILGWFISPNAKGFRYVLLWISGALLVIVATVQNGPFGWSATSVVAIFGFVMALWYWIGTAIKNWSDPPNTFGSSRWASMEDLADHNVLGEDGILFGKVIGEDDFEWVSYKGDRHLLTVAPTRSGKGTTQIIPNLLTYKGSMLVIDPKGENAMISAKRRMDMGQEVHIVDPWGIVDLDIVDQNQEIEDVLAVSPSGDITTSDPTASCFNPLDWLDYTSNEITENAMILADALVMGENHNDSFWNEEAKALLQGLLLYVASELEEDGHRHLGRVRDILVMGKDELDKIFARMANSDHHIISSTGNRCLQKDPKLLSNVLASAQAQTHFLDSEFLRKNLNASSFKFEDLKSKPMTIYLVLPADRLNTFSRWLRLLVQQAITVNARNIQTKPDKPVLFILDEFAALGRLSMVEQAYGLMAGFGMQIWAIVQDLNQLERVYDKGWQSFIANAGMVNYFGSSDQKTAEYFSALCGEKTVWNFGSAVSNAVSKSLDLNGNRNGTETTTFTSNTSAVQRKLAFPDELMRMHSSTQLVFTENLYPLHAYKENWYDDAILRDLGVNLHTEEPETISGEKSEPSAE